MTVDARSSQRFEVEQAVSGLWQVTDRRTNRPALLNGHMQLGMNEREARELVATLRNPPARSFTTEGLYRLIEGRAAASRP